MTAPSPTPTLDVIRPILLRTYGDGSMPDALAKHMANVLDLNPNPSKRERIIMMMCWDWFAGGDTAAAVAREIEEALA